MGVIWFLYHDVSRFDLLGTDFNTEVGALIQLGPTLSSAARIEDAKGLGQFGFLW